MNLNENTLAVLKNFSSIQLNLVIPEGNVLKTIADAKNVMAVAELEQEFPQEFGVYDMNEFLSVLTLVDSPDLTFEDESLKVSDSNGRSSVRYFYSDKSILTSPSKDITMPECEVSFTLDESTLHRVRKAASVLGHEKMIISPVDGAIRLSVTDNSDSTSNSFSIEVPGSYEEGVDFSFVMNINNMKLIAGDYDVEVSSKLLSRFSNKTSKVTYYIAMEKSSTYGG